MVTCLSQGMLGVDTVLKKECESYYYKIKVCSAENAYLFGFLSKYVPNIGLLQQNLQMLDFFFVLYIY